MSNNKLKKKKSLKKNLSDEQASRLYTNTIALFTSAIPLIDEMYSQGFLSQKLKLKGKSFLDDLENFIKDSFNAYKRIEEVEGNAGYTMTSASKIAELSGRIDKVLEWDNLRTVDDRKYYLIRVLKHSFLQQYKDGNFKEMTPREFVTYRNEEIAYIVKYLLKYEVIIF